MTALQRARECEACAAAAATPVKSNGRHLIEQTLVLRERPHGTHCAHWWGWGSASAGPLDLLIMTVAEGGIRRPMLIAGPGVKNGRQVDTFAYVWDVIRTVLEPVFRTLRNIGAGSGKGCEASSCITW